MIIRILNDADTAQSLASRAMERIKALGLPMLPSVYAVWYAYLADADPRLTAAIDARLDQDQAIDTWFCQDLYERYFTASGTLETCQVALRAAATPLREASDALHQIPNPADLASTFRQDLQDDYAACPPNAQRAIRAMMGRLKSMGERIEKIRTQVERHLESGSSAMRQVCASLEAHHREARTDPLTKVSNRRQFDESLAAMIRDHAAGKIEDLALILTDIDHFKRFNDTYGHKTGDFVLITFARLLQEQTGERGLVARFGGEEFAILLPGVPFHEAYALSNQMRAELARRRPVDRRNQIVLAGITASFGLAMLRPGEEASAFVERADRLLYQAKEFGRNRVIGEGNPPAPRVNGFEGSILTKPGVAPGRAVSRRS